MFGSKTHRRLVPLLSRAQILTVVASLVLVANAASAQEPAKEAGSAEMAIPKGNDPSLKEGPGAPAEGTATERAKLLVQAIRQNEPAIALPFFFPAKAFDLVKAIKKPSRYHKKLVRVYNEDIALMRKSLRDPDNVEFVSFKLGRTKRWMAKGKEGNNLPYYATYKSTITVKDKGRERQLKVRVMITWDDQWYVTHLTNK